MKLYDQYICFLFFFQKQQADSQKQAKEKLSEQLGCQKMDRESYELMTNELEILRRTVEEQDKTVNALKMACAVSLIENVSKQQCMPDWSKMKIFEMYTWGMVDVI